MRKTKIVCTLGPACSDADTLAKMCRAGMNVARLNFSHGTHEEHAERIALVKKVRGELGLPIAIMLDTKGPEYRIKTFKNGGILLHEGDRFAFTAEEIEGDESRVSVNYKDLPKDLETGDTILLNNGLMAFEVTDTTDTEVNCVVTVGGELTNRKSMSFPGKTLKQVYLSEQDKSDIRFGVEHDIDFIACSFVSCRQDILDVKNYLQEIGASGIDLIAKIENRSGVDHIEAICEECDGIMVARGDMGVEIPYEELPAIQKEIIMKCRMLGKRVITATEMLESMIHHARPTRAEISDVANAVYDGTSAVMLSGETAAGKYPVEAVKTMAKIAMQAEQDAFDMKCYDGLKYDNDSDDTTNAICDAACTTAKDLNAKAIIAVTKSGHTARRVSKYRPQVPIVAPTPNPKTFHQLSLSWGVYPVMALYQNNTNTLFDHAIACAKMYGYVNENDRVVLTGGKTKSTDILNVQIVKTREK